LKKAEKELKEGKKHRGLVRVKPNKSLAEDHIKKAEHNLNAISSFKKIGYSDWSASAAFYAAYHCFLAIIAKFGYESRNQECTFALIYNLIESGKIDLEEETVKKVYDLSSEESQESSSIIDIRENEQYGISLSIEDDVLNKIIMTVKSILDKTKEIIEE
jgi:uncharacterized protein (UPF0332 family)